MFIQKAKHGIYRHGKVWNITLALSVCFIQNNQAADYLPEIIQRVQDYQSTQGIWQTQQSIVDANLKQSQLWKNPSFSIEQTGFNSTQERELAIGITQALDIFGERQAQQNIAVIAQSQLNLKQEIYQAQLALVVKQLWSQVAIADMQQQLVTEQLQLSQQMLQVTQKSYRAGAVAQINVDRMQMTVLEDQRRYQQAQLQLQLAQQQLQNLWGGQELATLPNNLMNFSDIFPDLTEEKVADHLQRNWLQKTIQLDKLRQNAEVEHLKAQVKPNPTLSLGITQVNNPAEASYAQLNVGLEIPLNLFDRQQYKIAANLSKQSALQQQQKFYQQQNQLDIQTVLHGLAAYRQQFKQIQTEQIPLAEQVRQKTLLGFEAGKLSVTDVQQAALQLQDVRLRKIEVLKAAWQSAVEAESLSLGIDPNMVMAKDALAQINQSLWQDTQNMTIFGE